MQGESVHLGTDNESSNEAREDDDRLEDIQAVEGGHELVLHVLVIDDGLLQPLPLQLLVVEALDRLVV